MISDHGMPKDQNYRITKFDINHPICSGVNIVLLSFRNVIAKITIHKKIFGNEEINDITENKDIEPRTTT